MYVGRRIRSLGHYDRQSHDTPIPLIKYLRFMKIKPAVYQVFMEQYELNPMWIEKGHVQKRKINGKIVTLNVPPVKGRYFFRGGVDDFKGSGDFQRIIADEIAKSNLSLKGSAKVVTAGFEGIDESD
jgi:hypothetical protein